MVLLVLKNKFHEIYEITIEVMLNFDGFIIA